MIRSPVAGATPVPTTPHADSDVLALTIRYSIAVDGPPRFRREALGWLATGAALGGVTADQVVVQCANAVPDAFVEPSLGRSASR